MAKIPRRTWQHQVRGEADEMQQRSLRENGWSGEAARRKALALLNRGGVEGRSDARRGAVYCTSLNSIGHKALAPLVRT